MTMESILAQLRARIGIDPDSLGSKVVPLVVVARQRSQGFADLATYAGHLRTSPEELAALVDDLVVPETWFFRGGELFPFLATRIRDLATARTAAHPVRILSVPCSTGEEPYSLAMALADLQVPAQAWRIDAVDISARHLARARAGHYSEFSFRQTDPQLRSRYFRPVGGHWELDAAIRATVHFRQENLVTEGFLADEAPYDVILCRNLLIYLHDAARRQVVETLDRLLAPAGWIAMGHAEPLSAIDRRFGHVGPDGCFLFMRQAAAPVAAATVLPTLRTALASPPKPPRPATAVLPPPKSAKILPRPAPVSASAASADRLAVAREHADAGRLDAAWSECQAQLAAGEPTADLYAILGFVHKARQDETESKRCFERALYLQPDHRDALLQLMLLYEQEGAQTQAALMRGRLDRARARGDA